MALNTDKVKTMAYADDIVIITQTRYDLENALKKFEKWLHEHKLMINRGKSGIMITQSDIRITNRDPESIMGIPIVSSYKYLGVHIQSNLTCKLQNTNLTNFKKAFLSKLGAKSGYMITGKSRLIIWKSFFLTRAFYGNLILA